MANDIIKNMGFHHVALKCKDIEKSLAMYTALGMKEIVRWGEGEGLAVMLDIGDGGKIELFAGGTDEENQNARWLHFAMSVDDVEGAYKTALDAGFTPMTAPAVVHPDSTPYKIGINMAFVKGPDNEQVEFFKEV